MRGPACSALLFRLSYRQREHQIFESKLRVAKSVNGRFDHGPVRRRFRTSEREPEQLLYHALLALGALRQHLAQLFGRMKCRVRNSSDLAACVQGQLRVGWLGLLLLAARTEGERQFLAPPSDSVKFLQSEADRIDEI